MGRRNHQVELFIGRARVADPDELRPAAALFADPARDRDAPSPDADRNVRPWGLKPFEAVAPDVVDVSIILEEMEKKLFDEGRKELFAVLIKEVTRVKAELAIIRQRTVKDQGYDSFKEEIIHARAAEVMPELVNEEMDGRKKRLVDVATQIMVSQGVVGRNDEGGIRSLRNRLDEQFRKGRVHGFASALELFYERR